VTTDNQRFTRNEPGTTGVVPTFSFGQNWSEFLQRALSPEKVALAQEQTAKFLNLSRFDGRTFLDVGCGSGVFSHAAFTLGAKQVTSFDVDPLSVRCCEYMRERAGNPSNWAVLHGSILDDAFVATLPAADIVYSWGVLHHTGDMWRAIRNAASLVKPNGLFFIAIYNKVEFDSLKSYRGSHGWVRLKRRYNQSGRLGKRALEGIFAAKDIAKWIVTLRNPFAEIRAYKAMRGMSWWYDIVDWLGGYPYEFASPADIFAFCHGELGFKLENMSTCTSIGCNEFLFSVPAQLPRAHPGTASSEPKNP
jgi:2-polyprenyl-3-methyl-5-hydroxy-6-metoxy-1,4-benzoquinol methylase